MMDIVGNVSLYKALFDVSRHISYSQPELLYSYVTLSGGSGMSTPEKENLILILSFGEINPKREPQELIW